MANQQPATSNQQPTSNIRHPVPSRRHPHIPTPTFRRLRRQLGLTLALALGLTVAVALVVAIPLYANAIGQRLLVEQLSQNAARPPFAFLFRYLGDWHGPLEWEAIRDADAYLSNEVAADLGLPQQSLVRHVRTPKYRLFPGDATGYENSASPLAWLSLGFLDDVEAHIHVTEGEVLSAAPPGKTLPVLAARALADQLGLQVGESYVLAAAGDAQATLHVHVVGIWEPADRDPAYWLYLPENFDEVLLTTESIFEEHIAPALEGEVGAAAWYLVADGERVSGPRVAQVQAHILAVRARLDALLPNLTLDQSPEEALQSYREETRQLTLLLYAFGAPVLALVLTFVSQAAGMTVLREQSEIVVLRSRGATRGDVLSLYLGRWGLLGLVALLAGGPLGWAAATWMARTRSFLQFAPQSVPHVALDLQSWSLGLIALALALPASAIPAQRAARHTIVTHGQAHKRRYRPWWQRYFLDVALAFPAGYGYVLLRRPERQPLAHLTQGDLFGNPLLFLAPLLFIFAGALLLLRLFPAVMEALARAARRLRSAVPLLVCHDLSEQVQRVSGPLLLLVLTTAIATFSASLAQTLDTALHDRVYYQIGADVQLVEQGESTQEAASTGDGAAEPDAESTWVFLPIAEHRDLPGVRAATRVGDYSTGVTLGGQVERGRFLGVDRLDFPGAAFFRDDFAADSLGALMNALAAEPRGVLVERRFLERHSLQPGDTLSLEVNVLGERAEVTLVVAGALDYFPTLYPEDGPFFVANLSYLFTRLGGLYPYDVWLANEPGSTDGIVAALNARGVPVISVQDARARILAEQSRPRRQGLFGLLTMGFLGAGVLTLLSLGLHALLSFRERRVELGVLRAIGFSTGQMRRYLAGMQATLLLLGLGAGSLLGGFGGRLFIPFLQADAGLHPNTPPLVAQTDWRTLLLVYALFALAAAVTLGITLVALRRMRLYEAIKMGENA